MMLREALRAIEQARTDKTFGPGYISPVTKVLQQRDEIAALRASLTVSERSREEYIEETIRLRAELDVARASRTQVLVKTEGGA